MIALCAEHHAKAEGGAFTKGDLHTLKASEYRKYEIAGRFDWMRREIIVRAGSAYFVARPFALAVGNIPLVWFNRDGEGHYLLNINVMSQSGQVGAVMRDNFWMLGDRPEDLLCPPSGRVLDVRYGTGDMFRVEFREINNGGEGTKAFGELWEALSVTNYPITVCDIGYRIVGTSIDVSPKRFRFGPMLGRNTVFNNVGPIMLPPLDQLRV
jgi:hypothetical protein